MSDAKKGKPKPEGSGISNKKIEVTDLETQEPPKIYDSINAVAKALNIRVSSIFYNLNC
jgi:hypothetical protein